jgi:hypothetical protein
VGSRDARWARLEDATREDTRALQEAREELERVSRERREVGSELSVSQSRVENLTRLLGEATRETERLNAHVAEREQVVTQLEAELLAKQKALDLLDRNVQLINDLGASLQDFDRAFPGAGPQVLSTELVQVDPPVAAEPERAPIAKNRAVDSARFTRKLVALDDDQGLTYALNKDDTTIGRSALADIVIRNPYISRVHARILSRDADTVIEDPGSKNGVRVNNRPINRRATLHDGDTISLGGALEFRYVDSHERPPPH